MIIRTILCCLFAMVALCGRTSAAESAPILAVFEANTQSMEALSDFPSFVLYDDGTIISLRVQPPTEARAEEPFVTRKVTDAKNFAEKLFAFDLAKTEAFYPLTTALHEDVTVVWTPAKVVSVYGDWREARKTDFDARLKETASPRIKAMIEEKRRREEAFPVELQQALLRIDEQRLTAGSAWLPKKFRALLWPYEHAPGKIVPWPRGWPGLGANETEAYPDDQYILALPIENLAAFRKLLQASGQFGAVLIDRKKMTARHWFPLPGEAAWLKALQP